VAFPFYRTYDVPRQSSGACKALIALKTTEKTGVGGPTPPLATIIPKDLFGLLARLQSAVSPHAEMRIIVMIRISMTLKNLLERTE